MIAGPHDTESMNRHVEQMVKEALLCGEVENLFNVKNDEELFSPEFLKNLEDVKLPNTKFQLLVKALKSAIKEYKHVNKLAAEKFEKMLQDTVLEYNTRDNFTFTNDVASDTIQSIQSVVDAKVQTLNGKLIAILNGLHKDKEEFKNLGITFEEKAFYDVLVDVRNRHKFEYSDEKCRALCVKIKELIDNTAVYADWLNNNNVKDDLSYELANLLYSNGYPPTWSPEVFTKVLEQVENFKNYEPETTVEYKFDNNEGELNAAISDPPTAETKSVK
jgi:type I restriction enzyme R subunit